MHDYRCNGLYLDPGMWAHQFVSGMFVVLSGVNHQSSHVRGSFLLGSLHLSKGYSCIMQCVTHLLFGNFISLSRSFASWISKVILWSAYGSANACV